VVKKTSGWTLPPTRREIQYLLFTWTGFCAYCGAEARPARSYILNVVVLDINFVHSMTYSELQSRDSR
jgi:hypothetical protein